MEQSVINEGLLSLEDVYAENNLEFKASFDRDVFTLEAFCEDTPENLELHTSIFFDAAFYFPMMENWSYKFMMSTFKDIGAPAALASNMVVMETNAGLMPDTGGVTRSEWDRFVKQLVYTVNGDPASLEEPEDFLPEDGE